MVTSHDSWQRIRKLSGSSDKFDRVQALSLPVGLLENALTAVGIEKKRGLSFMKRIEQSNINLGKDWVSNIKNLRAAVEARHAAVHEHIVGTTNECREHVRFLFKAWSALRKKYVTKRTAARLAHEFLAFQYFSDIFLFGSLARGVREAKDIDLLLVDNGEISSMGSGYVIEDTLAILEAVYLLTEANRKAVECGWLNIIVISGPLFVSDLEYRRNVAKNQRDPLFFLNIAQDLLSYDFKRHRWTKSHDQTFKKLASLRKYLENEGIVYSHQEPLKEAW